jgi:hypothetical protein
LEGNREIVQQAANRGHPAERCGNDPQNSQPNGSGQSSQRRSLQTAAQNVSDGLAGEKRLPRAQKECLGVVHGERV